VMVSRINGPSGLVRAGCHWSVSVNRSALLDGLVHHRTGSMRQLSFAQKTTSQVKQSDDAPDRVHVHQTGSDANSCSRPCETLFGFGN
jgi:hypothetical protein